jgi:hypothetical protein
VAKVRRAGADGEGDGEDGGGDAEAGWIKATYYNLTLACSESDRVFHLVVIGEDKERYVLDLTNFKKYKALMGKALAAMATALPYWEVSFKVEGGKIIDFK